MAMARALAKSVSMGAEGLVAWCKIYFRGSFSVWVPWVWMHLTRGFGGGSGPVRKGMSLGGGVHVRRHAGGRPPCISIPVPRSLSQRKDAAVAALRQYCRARGMQPPVCDGGHRCSAACQWWCWPEDRDVYVCQYGGNVHVCGSEHCPGPYVETPDCARVCTITGRELHGSPMVTVFQVRTTSPLLWLWLWLWLWLFHSGFGSYCDGCVQDTERCCAYLFFFCWRWRRILLFVAHGEFFVVL